jgi:hypothetical protein
MLAQALARGAVDDVVNEMAGLIETNEADILFVRTLIGVRIDQKTQFGPDIQLTPVSSLPRSIQRGRALGQDPSFPGQWWSPQATAALTIEGKISPVFLSTEDTNALLSGVFRTNRLEVSDLQWLFGDFWWCRLEGRGGFPDSFPGRARTCTPERRFFPN